LKLWDGFRQRNKTLQAAGIANLKRAVDSDRDKHDFALEDYLNGLTDTGKARNAMAQYEQWANAGIVPVAASGATDNQPNQRLRLSYAIALRTVGQWRKATDEFRVLSLLDIEFTKKAIGDLKRQAVNANADPKIIANVETLEKHGVSDYEERNFPNKNIPESTPKMRETKSLSQVSIQ
jgi:hypothetical protein